MANSKAYSAVSGADNADNNHDQTNYSDNPSATFRDNNNNDNDVSEAPMVIAAQSLDLEATQDQNELYQNERTFKRNLVAALCLLAAVAFGGREYYIRNYSDDRISWTATTIGGADANTNNNANNVNGIRGSSGGSSSTSSNDNDPIEIIRDYWGTNATTSKSNDFEIAEELFEGANDFEDGEVYDVMEGGGEDDDLDGIEEFEGDVDDEINNGEIDGGKFDSDLDYEDNEFDDEFIGADDDEIVLLDDDTEYVGGESGIVVPDEEDGGEDSVSGGKTFDIDENNGEGIEFHPSQDHTGPSHVSEDQDQGTDDEQDDESLDMAGLSATLDEDPLEDEETTSSQEDAPLEEEGDDEIDENPEEDASPDEHLDDEKTSGIPEDDFVEEGKETTENPEEDAAQGSTDQSQEDTLPEEEDSNGEEIAKVLGDVLPDDENNTAEEEMADNSEEDISPAAEVRESPQGGDEEELPDYFVPFTPAEREQFKEKLRSTVRATKNSLLMKDVSKPQRTLVLDSDSPKQFMHMHHMKTGMKIELPTLFLLMHLY